MVKLNTVFQTQAKPDFKYFAHMTVMLIKKKCSIEICIRPHYNVNIRR